MDDFRAASTISAVASGTSRFRWQVPEGWQQGRGAFGGLVLGTLARAMSACEADAARALRTISGELCAPAMVGETEVAVEVLRRGSGTTYLEARASQAGALVARASGLQAAPRRAAAARATPTPPELPPVERLPEVPMLPMSPPFSRHFEFRFAGSVPFSGHPTPQLVGYLRGRRRAAPLDAAAVIALLDAWWPCALSAEPAPRAMATVTFLAELLVDPAALDPEGYFAYRARLAGDTDGYTVELRELWQGDRLIALNQQMFAAL
ncbi:MAG: thioesterase family protein [Kofleriaceae bacterium]